MIWSTESNRRPFTHIINTVILKFLIFIGLMFPAFALLFAILVALKQGNRHRILRRKETKRDERILESKTKYRRCQFRKHYKGRPGHEVGAINYVLPISQKCRIHNAEHILHLDQAAANPAQRITKHTGTSRN